MKSRTQKGSALIFALIFLLVLSVMAASMMFLSQSETWSGMNYKMMTQTRYGAEAGIHAAANYLMYTYTPPASMAGFNTGVYPVKTNGGSNVVLSSITGVPVTYPNSSVRSAFRNATNSSSAGTTLYAGSGPGAVPINYTATAQLMAMAQVTPYGSPTPITVQTWQLTAHGDINGVKNAESEVSAVLERQVSPTFAFAAFATAGGCGALTFSGNGTTNSYDSSTLAVNNGVVTAPSTFQDYGGNVGTNGNQTDNGTNVQIYGSLSTPRVGVGSCSSGSVTAFTGNSTTQISGGIIELPQAINLPTPVIPAPGNTNINISNANQSQTLGPCQIAPCAYGDISISGGGCGNGNNCSGPTLTLKPGTYNVNSISVTGQGQIAVDLTGCVANCYVVINVAGNNNTTPLDLEGLALSNPTYDSTVVQFNYAGTGSVKIAGNGASAAVIYAPNATASFKGNASFYGAVIANQVTDVGNGEIHYDRKLQRKLFTVGNYMLSSFTWSKF